MIGLSATATTRVNLGGNCIAYPQISPFDFTEVDEERALFFDIINRSEERRLGKEC